MWNLKYDTNELIDEIETGSQMQRIDLWLPKWRVGEGLDRGLGLADVSYHIQNGYTTRPYCIGQITIFYDEA